MQILSIVPAPVSAHRGAGGPFRFDRGARLMIAPGSVPRAIADEASHQLDRIAHRRVPAVDRTDGAPGGVVLRLTTDRTRVGVSPDVDAARASGAYRLEVRADAIVLEALAAPGLLHGLATLAQVAPLPGASGAHGDGVVEVPDVTVVDVPRFGWRGLGLDVARHFFDLEAITLVLDVMAGLRLNVLHLHLTDDQGWRLEIPSRPALTVLSGTSAVDGDPGGFYTVADFAELTARAAARGISVVPEIDLPGHVNAALHAYGELTPSGSAADVYTGIEVGFSRLHADLPATEDFLRDVLTGVAAMTAGPYVHLGGDEVLTIGPGEYAALIRSAGAHLRAAGKTVVGWQEAATALGADAVVQYWTDTKDTRPVVAAARAGARVLLSPADRVYLDMKYDATSDLGLSWAGYVELRDSYAWEPLDALPGLPAGCVIGVEAAIWTETLRTTEDLVHMLLPRLAAVAEVAWSEPERRGWDDFASRLRGVAPRWTAAGLGWYRSPQVDW